jgi:hypothetical protein
VAQGHWTNDARKLLEQSRNQIPQVDKLLHLWPRENEKGPEVVGAVLNLP